MTFPLPVPVPTKPPTTVKGALRLANRLAMAGTMVSGRDAEGLFREAGRALALAWVLSRSESCGDNLRCLGPSKR